MAVDVAETEEVLEGPLSVIGDDAADTFASVKTGNPLIAVAMGEVAVLESLAAGTASGTSLLLSVPGVVVVRTGTSEASRVASQACLIVTRVLFHGLGKEHSSQVNHRDDHGTSTSSSKESAIDHHTLPEPPKGVVIPDNSSGPGPASMASGNPENSIVAQAVALMTKKHGDAIYGAR
ncbi:hypothetical protein PG985_014925 [Apiospora marii]|uniref:Uncharacterized protein n=1 Tax=Apiospora marii TaxID=335849 RepID=A0ABR1RIW0_9PEZI